VTIPSTHENKVLENHGYISDVKIVDSADKPGEKVLMGAHKFTEPETEAKVRRGSVANRSCGILYNYIDTETGTCFPQVLEHVALTNKPWVRGMAAYGDLSEANLSDREVVPMFLSETVHKVASDVDVEPIVIKPVSTKMSEEEVKKELNLADVMWGTEPSLNSIRSQLVDHFRTMRPAGEYGAPYYSCMDVTATKALICVDYGMDDDCDDNWVVPFTVDADNKVAVSDFSQWTPVTQEWVKDEDAATDRDETAATGAQLSEVAQSRLQLSQGQKTDRQGGAMTPTTAEVLSRLELSEEARAIVKEIVAENERNKALLAETTKATRVANVANRVKDLQSRAFPPGFLKEYEAIALSDDGQVATVLHLSEGGTSSQIEQTATQIADRLIAALPVDDSGKLALADQASLLENPLTARPAATAEEQAEIADKNKKPMSADEQLAEWEAAAPGSTRGMNLSTEGKAV